MKMTGARFAVILLAALCLSACVTTGPTDKLSPPNEEDAARLNLDLGVSYLQQNKLEEALEKLQKSIEAKPENPSAYLVMAYVYQRLQDPVRAEQSYRKAVKVGPKNQAALNALGVYLCRQNDDIDESLRYFDRALEVPEYQNRHEIFINAGRCAMQQDLAQAEQYLRRGISIKPDFPQGLFLLSDVAYRQGEYLQARAFIERRLAAAPPQPDVLWLAQRIEIELGDRVAAQTYRARLLNDFPDSRQARQAMEAPSDRG